MNKYMLFTLVLTALLLPRTTWGEAACPWVTKATASDILDGAVSLDMQSADGVTGTCVFQSQGHGSPHILQIVVRNMEGGHETMDDESHCTSNREPLKGIGNDAVLCDIDTSSLREAQVIGRVRNMIFAIRIESRGRRLESTEKMLRDKAKFAVEQVSGNLF